LHIIVLDKCVVGHKTFLYTDLLDMNVLTRNMLDRNVIDKNVLYVKYTVFSFTIFAPNIYISEIRAKYNILQLHVNSTPVLLRFLPELKWLDMFS